MYNINDVLKSKPVDQVLFAADPIGYLKETSPNIQVTVTDENGQPYHPKNTPYNPIEKE